jgi:hypothetical protein
LRDFMGLEQRAGGVIGIGQEEDSRPIAQRAQRLGQGEPHFAVVAQGVHARIKKHGVDAVHGESGVGQEDFVTRRYEGVEHQAQGFVCAVGKHQFLRTDAECPRQPPPRGLVLRVHGDVSCGNPHQRGAHRRRTAEGVLVVVEAQEALAAFADAELGGHALDGRARLDASLHRAPCGLDSRNADCEGLCGQALRARQRQFPFPAPKEKTREHRTVPAGLMSAFLKRATHTPHARAGAVRMAVMTVKYSHQAG